MAQAQPDDGAALAGSGARRPESLIDLFSGGKPYEGWESYNWKRRRFYILNLRYILGALRLSHTSSDVYFLEARKEINSKTTWPMQFKGDYSCSKTQIYPRNAESPKLLDKAAAIIVALELAAAREGEVNIYDFLRIVPAFYFLGGLTRRRLDELRRHYAEENLRWRKDATGLANPPGTFDAACAQVIRQPSPQILTELTQGFCATRAVVDAIGYFVERAFPADLSVGSVQTAGNGGAEGLGVRDAAPSLRVQERGLTHVDPIAC